MLKRFFLSALLLLAAVLSAGLSFAAGLTLYSYRDDRGQTIVVDSIERVPMRYRDQIETGFVPTFSQKKEKAKEKPATRQNSPEIRISGQVSNSGVMVVEPPPEEEGVNPAIATATLIMEQIRAIQLNNERINVQALVRGVNHPVIRHLHLTNIMALRDIHSPGQLNWPEGQQWQKQAQIVIEQFRTIQYTLSRWIDSGSDAVIHALPPLLATLKGHIIQLESDFSSALAANNPGEQY